ncbi:MAG: SDR family oxidoreductase [Candidatus Latescibacteria bacterium]|nr:SDR family oxidoreductase [Candidatus Latescibacterota bacterium]
MRLAVVGAAGLLGQKLFEAATVAGHEVAPFDLDTGIQTPAGPISPLDITDAGAVMAAMEGLGPDWVLNTAAFTAVDASEANQERVRAVNVGGVANILSATDATGTRLVTLSTDYVFDGRNGPYTEDAPRRPLGVYGASKAEMEDIVVKDGGRHLVIRTMVLYGAASGIRTNFALWVVQKLRAGEKIRVVTDQMGNPTLASDLARMILTMVEHGGAGLYHAAGADRVSRYEFAVRAARIFGLDGDKIIPVTTGELGQEADRPLESGFVLDRLRSDFGIQPAGLDESLALFREEVEKYGDGM